MPLSHQIFINWTLEIPGSDHFIHKFRGMWWRPGPIPSATGEPMLLKDCSIPGEILSLPWAPGVEPPQPRAPDRTARLLRESKRVGSDGSSHPGPTVLRRGKEPWPAS